MLITYLWRLPRDVYVGPLLIAGTLARQRHFRYISLTSKPAVEQSFGKCELGQSQYSFVLSLDSTVKELASHLHSIGPFDVDGRCNVLKLVSLLLYT